MKFTPPNPLNGETLQKELANAGIFLDIILIDGNRDLVLDIDETNKEKVLTILKNHDGNDVIPEIVKNRNSAHAKLQLLGLTPEEIATL